MDSFVKCFFEEVLVELGCQTLNRKYKRHQLGEYLNNAIIRYAKAQDMPEEAMCKNFVVSALQYYNTCNMNNEDLCLMGKYHKMLYIAMKIAFDWKLQDNEVIAALLNQLYACDGTFERIFSGTVYLIGWKSEFEDKEESVSAVIFFLDHAIHAKLEFNDGMKTYRFIDVPLDSFRHEPPTYFAIKMSAADMLVLFLRYGAIITADYVESILQRLIHSHRTYSNQLLTCLKFALRAVPRLNFTVDKTEFDDLELPDDYNYQREIVSKKYKKLLEDHVIPTERCGLKPVELKHLCRCKVRERLWENFQLPYGIQRLPIPNQVKRYLNLCED